MRIASFDYMRGVAILIIVAGHCYDSWQIDSFGERVLADLISGGTSLFVFISGFFFHYIFYQRFNYVDFMKKKIQLVFMPYLFLSTLGLFALYQLKFPLPVQELLHLGPLTGFGDFLWAFELYILTGKTTIAYWYIPFIMIVFALSPLFIFYIRLDAKTRIQLFFTLLIVSLIIHRPMDNLSPMHSVLYFLPIYLLGIICSIHRIQIIEYIHNKTFALGLLTLFFALFQAGFYLDYGSMHKVSIFSYNGFDISLLQKVCLCLFLFSFLHRYEHQSLPRLKFLADSSFAIFFVHPWVIMFVDYSNVVSSVGAAGFTAFVFKTTIVLALTLFAIVFGKQLLQRRSRLIIGW